MSAELVSSRVEQAVRQGFVEALVDRFLVLPQPCLDVRHVFGPRLYMRELTAPAGTLLIGRPHREEHGCLLVMGALSFFNADGTRTVIEAPAEFTASPGRKVAEVLESVVFVNYWHTEETDVETLEAMLFADCAPVDTRPMQPDDGDYACMLAEQGASAEVVRQVSERADDCCAFPFGAYKIKVGRSRIEGRGLIATAGIEAGEIIAPGSWAGKRTPAGRYTNHARDPNAFFCYDGAGTAWLVAHRAIAGCAGPWDGEEITINYRHTPRDRWRDLT
jgi:hypothetical protein